ncbi:hypothetical protein ES332_D08G260100v1 [Gossypium tomentosum]|uniref:Uncharacterized protein n=1 Tax=Gossypium tomentosum TaxID=34277 RepID=A0A5D2K1Z5_GOSTO|nr:hypothetical protein ES332_D08G260100v1 [Gossypium tomentosum]
MEMRYLHEGSTLLQRSYLPHYKQQGLTQIWSSLSRRPHKKGWHFSPFVNFV